MTPTSTMPSGSNRHRTLNSTNRINVMMPIEINASVAMPPVR